MKLKEELEKAEANFNPSINMLSGTWQGPGYHSLVSNGTKVHETRKSIYYALALLSAGDHSRQDRALAIIRTVLSLQDRNPYHPTYGIWPWLYEESLEKMSPPDWNWADFIGAALCHLLTEYRDRLPDGLRTETEIALGHAAWSIFRRNVQPNYTNIAIMGAAVTAVAGEVLHENRLLIYARERIRAFVDFTAETGGLNEYNSPTYTLIAMHEVERMLQLVKDQTIRADAEKLRRIIWQALADRFHPATAQLAGPHSRAYSDRLNVTTINYLNETTGLTLPIHPTATVPEFSYEGVKHLPCPEDMKNRFRRLPQPEIELYDRFVKRDPDDQSFYGTTWMSEQCCLGSVNRECFWTQRRPVLAYWKTEVDPAVTLKMRFFHDGRDFASAGIYTLQRRNVILNGIRMLSDRGDYHIHLDRPKDGSFTAASLVLRYELHGQEAISREVGQGRFELAAGDFKAVIHTRPGNFGRAGINWRCGKDAASAYVEAVCYEGPNKHFTFDDHFTMELGSALEIVPRQEQAVNSPVQLQTDGHIVNLQWRDLKLSYPRHAGRYD